MPERPSSSKPIGASPARPTRCWASAISWPKIFSERADLRQRLRKILQRTGKLTSARAEPDDKKSQGFRDYFAYAEQLAQVPPHRVLAINRGERAKMLRVKVEADMAAMEQTADELLVPADHPHADLLRGCARDALARLVFPSLDARSAARADRSGRSPRRAGLRPQPAQPAVAAAGAVAAGVGGRSGIQERLQAGRARRVRQSAGARGDSSGRQGRAPRRGQGQDRRIDRPRTICRWWPSATAPPAARRKS